MGYSDESKNGMGKFDIKIVIIVFQHSSWTRREIIDVILNARYKILGIKAKFIYSFFPINTTEESLITWFNLDSIDTSPFDMLQRTHVRSQLFYLRVKRRIAL